MKVTVYRADQGDCLMLSTSGGTHVLIDGGMRGAYQEHVAPAMGELADANISLDLVCVSHIDNDHIGGIRQMMDDMAAWRIYDYQASMGNTHFERPAAPRPANVKELWHNAFKDQLQDNSGDIEAQLVANAKLFNMSRRLLSESIISQAQNYERLTTGVREALLLQRRLGAWQLNIPSNSPFGGGLVMADRADAEGDRIPVGDLGLTIVGPFKEDLERLRGEWNKWLAENSVAVRKIRHEAREEEGKFPMMDEGELVLSSLLSLATELGNRNAVTTPNLASIMFLAEADGKSVLLTGDGHADDVLKGLQLQGRLDGDGRIHVDVLKVQHHGSEHNIHQDFCAAVGADHYIFCGDGAHENPDLSVLQTVVDSRLGTGETGPWAGRPFKFWFSGSQQTALSPERADHMRKVERLVKKSQTKSHGRLRYRFLRRGSRMQVAL